MTEVYTLIVGSRFAWADLLMLPAVYLAYATGMMWSGYTIGNSLVLGQDDELRFVDGAIPRAEWKQNTRRRWRLGMWSTGGCLALWLFGHVW